MTSLKECYEISNKMYEDSKIKNPAIIKEIRAVFSELFDNYNMKNNELISADFNNSSYMSVENLNLDPDRLPSDDFFEGQIRIDVTDKEFVLTTGELELYKGESIKAKRTKRTYSYNQDGKMELEEKSFEYYEEKNNKKDFKNLSTIKKMTVQTDGKIDKSEEHSLMRDSIVGVKYAFRVWAEHDTIDFNDFPVYKYGNRVKLVRNSSKIKTKTGELEVVVGSQKQQDTKNHEYYIGLIPSKYQKLDRDLLNPEIKMSKWPEGRTEFIELVQKLATLATIDKSKAPK